MLAVVRAIARPTLAHMPSPHTDDALRAMVESRLARAIDSHIAVPRLAEACRYAVLGGGKRIRPLITMRCCEACGGDVSRALDGACAVELVHAFSLAHDDLPALDNDDVRRGRPTLHRAFPESLAILAGDALFAAALAVAMDDPHHGPALCAEVVGASLAMIDGQVMDTLPEARDDSIDPAALVEQIHSRKTGALIAASARMGAVCADVGPEDAKAIASWGTAIGLMFQIVDDWIDATQPASRAGKATGKDQAAGKSTWVGTLGVAGAVAHVDRLAREANAALHGLGDGAANLRRMTSELAGRRH